MIGFLKILQGTSALPTNWPRQSQKTVTMPATLSASNTNEQLDCGVAHSEDRTTDRHCWMQCGSKPPRPTCRRWANQMTLSTQCRVRCLQLWGEKKNQASTGSQHCHNIVVQRRPLELFRLLQTLTPCTSIGLEKASKTRQHDLSLMDKRLQHLSRLTKTCGELADMALEV